MCKYKKGDYITDIMNKENAFEPVTSLRFLRAAHVSGAALDNVVFVDCGINIGVHSLFMAANGIRVFGIDPLEENLLHVSLTFEMCVIS